MHTIRGFTLMELMITVVVAGVLLAVGIPSLQRLIVSNQRAAAATAFFSAINVARSEAISRNRVITICQRSSTDGPSHPVCETGPTIDWSLGWISYSDTDADFSGDEPDTADDILFVSEAIPDRFSLTNDLTDGRYFQLSNSGRPRTTSRIQFSLCDVKNIVDDRRVLIALSGRVRLDEFVCP